MRARALREVAADDDHVGALRLQVEEERLRDARVVLPEVEVGDVRERGHGAFGSAGRGTITRSALGRMR